MSCENCLGLIIIAVGCLCIGPYLIKKYFDDRDDHLTLFLALFFIIGGVGWLIWFLTTEWVLNIYESCVLILIILNFIPQLLLLIFILSYLKASKWIIIIVPGVAIVLLIIHLIFPDFYILTISSLVIIVSNIILFIINWRKNKDVKSLGFSTGLVFIFLGEIMLLLTLGLLMHGLFLTAAAIAWVISYSGVLDISLS